MDVHIRPATTNDLNALLDMEQALIEAERPFDATIKREPTRYYDLPKMIAGNDVELVVAEYGNEIIACGYARIEQAKPFYVFQQYAYLGFMYVKPPFRGKGINQQIIATLENWSRQQGITEVWLDVYYENEQAIRAYEKAGFSPMVAEMRKKL